MELEGEVNKLSSQQNPEWRTRDHARIKVRRNLYNTSLCISSIFFILLLITLFFSHHMQQEENNVLKLQLDELNLKLRRADVNSSRAKEELAWYRASSGKNQHSNIDKLHHQLSTKLKETEQDRMQLAQKLLGLCTSILKVRGT